MHAHAALGHSRCGRRRQRSAAARGCRRGRSALALAVHLAEIAPPVRLHRGERNAVLRTRGSRKRRLDRRHVELEHLRVLDRQRVVAPESLRLAVRLDGLHETFGAARQPHVRERLLVDREVADRRAILRRHVGDRRAVRERHLSEAGPEELHELVHDAVLAQHLGDAQHQVGGRHSLGQLAGELHAHHLRNQHVDGLSEHHGLRLDAAHTPAHDAKAVDHGGVAVGAHKRVGIEDAVLLPHDLREVLEVHLVHDARRGRHHAELVERALPPLEELVALAVALELELAVDGDRHARAERVDLHGVVDHEVAWHKRVHLARVAAERLHRAAHRGKVDNARHASEVLQHHAAGHEGDLLLAWVARVVVGDRLHVIRGDHVAVKVAQARLEQHLDRVRQAVDVADGPERGEAAVAALAHGSLEGG